MRVLGIDCGTERTGYGVIESDGRLHTLVACGCIRSSTRDPLEKRLLNIAGGLRALFAEHRPDYAAVEEVPTVEPNDRNRLGYHVWLYLRGELETLEEAVKEAEFRDREVFVFRDDKGRVKVLHRKKDGKLELIEAP